MKLLFIALIFFAGSCFAQQQSDSTSPSQNQSGPGPGNSLPEHSKTKEINLSKLQSRAIALSDRIKEPATDLFTLLALLTLIWTGYQAQFRGLPGFISPLLTIMITSALIIHYKEFVPVILDSRKQLIDSLSQNDFIFTKQLSSMMACIGTSVTIMSFSGIAAGFALFLIIFAVVLIYLTQILFEAVLITLGPLAIATVAFPQTRGIFSFWFKTWIGVLLIPVGWVLGAKFIGETFVIQDGDAISLLTSIISVLGYGAVFIGMPVITLMIVNAAGGAAATGMPSVLSMAASAIGGIQSLNSTNSTRSSLSTSSTNPGRSLPMGVTSASPIPSSTIQPSPISIRAVQAQQWHNQIKSIKKGSS